MKASEIDFPEIPDCKMVIGMTVAIKYVDSDGDVCFCFRTSEGVSHMEAHGMLSAAANLSMINLMGGFRE